MGDQDENRAPLALCFAAVSWDAVVFWVKALHAPLPVRPAVVRTKAVAEPSPWPTHEAFRVHRY